VSYLFRPATGRPLGQAFHDDSVNHGMHLVHTGGRFDSHLLVPRIAG
jgi:hypothetical protein